MVPMPVLYEETPIILGTWRAISLASSNFKVVTVIPIAEAGGPSSSEAPGKIPNNSLPNELNWLIKDNFFFLFY